MGNSEVDDQFLISRLADGKASQEERDKGLAQVIYEVRALRKELWRPTDLDERIEKVHKQLCSKCPLRVYYQQKVIHSEAKVFAGDGDERKRTFNSEIVWKVVMGLVTAISVAMAIIANLTKTAIQ